MLVTLRHATLNPPIRWVNDNQDLVVNGDTFQAMSFNLALPPQPADGLPSVTLTIANTGLKIIPDFLDSISGQGVTCQIQVVLRSAPNTIEYDTTLDAIGFSMTNESISAKLSPPNYFNMPWTSVLYGSKYSPALL